MGQVNKRKKHHDKDKYYRLAKEQGFRSRAAFKLTQINRKFPFLQESKIVLDLCAAPGGWTQVAARTMAQKSPNSTASASSGSHIVAVDILPIRAFKGYNNITTLIGDITTSKTKSDISNALKKVAYDNSSSLKSKNSLAIVDLVLHDGAPNIGSSYDKDAYEQNEISVHALRCATQHLKKGGHYITKIYRSRDYTSYLWICQQFFQTVTAFKPKASRDASSEIFLVCQNYKAPYKIDPKLLDPKYIFSTATGDEDDIKKATDGDDDDEELKPENGINIFHKSWDKKRRQRDGYDMDHLDATMRHIQPVSTFIETQGGGIKEAIQILSTCTGLKFSCSNPTCSNIDNEDKITTTTTFEKPTHCNCKFYLQHPLTTPEIKSCVVDLKVLNKGDFKGLISWREKMQEALLAKIESDKKEKKEKKKKKRGADEDDSDDDGSGSDSDDDNDKTTDDKNVDPDEMEKDEDEKIFKEIEEMKMKRLREKKRLKKKERTKASKRRKQAALGMDLNAIDIPEHDKTFSLATITSKGDLEAAAEVNLDKVTDEQLYIVGVNDDDGFVDREDTDDDDDEDDSDDDEETRKIKAAQRLDKELDNAYERYLKKTKDARAKSDTKMAKRSKKVQRLKAMEEEEEDELLLLTGKEGISSETKRYVKLLTKSGGDSDSSDDDDQEEIRKNGNDSSRSSDSEDDDGFNAPPLTPEESAKLLEKKKEKKEKKDKDGNPLIHKFADESTSAKTARWFSNPLFSSIGLKAESASTMKQNDGNNRKNNEDPMVMMDSGESSDDDNGDSESSEDESETDGKENQKKTSSKKDKKEKGDDGSNKKKKKRRLAGLDADEVLASMPKTDKEIRHEKRLKAMARDERKKAKRAKRLGETENDFEIAPANDEEEENNNNNNNKDGKTKKLTEEQQKRVSEARQLIKAGMGNTSTNLDGKSSTFEVVPSDRPVPLVDGRKYDSENEDYDSDDYARTLALGTMMLRRSKAKSLVDASYNRYAWNDAPDLPEWFVDDENKYYRPQLPIPPALLAKMKERQMALSVRPIAKVAEARARKTRRAKSKLAAARKKAESVANSSEMTETMKLKAISKALRQPDAKRPSKTYVVAKKSRGLKQGGKGMKVVDKREKSDKRGLQRSAKKRKGGKQGGLTGTKRRRQHS